MKEFKFAAMLAAALVSTTIIGATVSPAHPTAQAGAKPASLALQLQRNPAGDKDTSTRPDRTAAAPASRSATF